MADALVLERVSSQWAAFVAGFVAASVAEAGGHASLSSSLSSSEGKGGARTTSR